MARITPPKIGNGAVTYLLFDLMLRNVGLYFLSCGTSYDETCIHGTPYRYKSDEESPFTVNLRMSIRVVGPKLCPQLYVLTKYDGVPQCTSMH